MSVSLDEFIMSMCLENVPQPVIDKAKLCILDTIGVALAGRRLSAGQIAVQFALNTGGVGEAHLIGEREGFIVPAYLAAFANGILASCLDLDDGYYPAIGHAGAVVVPVALAVGERQQVSGKEFLEAVIVGYEVCLRGGKVLNSNFRERFFGSGAWAVYGGVASAAKLMGLNRKQINDALGVSMCHMPVSPVMSSIYYGSMTKESMGWSAMTGTVAALLAFKGFTGPKVSFEDPLRILDPEEALDMDGTWQIEKVYFKPYASCRWTHAPLDALRAILEENPIQDTDIKQIIVKTHKNALSLNHFSPGSSEAAQYSIPFTLGSLLCHGKVGPEEVAGDALNNPRVIDVARKVELVFDERLNSMVPEKRPARVEVILNNGSKYIKEILDPKGDPGNPWTRNEIEEKFISLAQPVLGSEKTSKNLDQIMKLEDLNNLSTLVKELVI